MKFTVSREVLLRPLQHVAGVVERRQTLPVLSNVLAVLDNNLLSITGTDSEVELVAKVPVNQEIAGEITIPAKKLLDICKSLPDSAEISFTQEDQKMVIKAGRSRFSLSTLPANDFPNLEDGPGTQKFTIAQKKFKRLIERTSFAMAQQDVRYYLNGLLVEISGSRFRCVATDGHRLALSDSELDDQSFDQLTKVIVPRKGILELARLMDPSDDLVSVALGANHIKVEIGDITFTSKLVDGKFPDYDRVLPKGGEISLVVDREEMKQALTRVSILSNEKYRGVRITLKEGNLEIIANNPEQEEAEENISVDYSGKEAEVGFNIAYLLDVMNVTKDEGVRITLADSNSSALLEELESNDSMYVVMPMRL